jgi:folate-binding protein YgfZ
VTGYEGLRSGAAWIDLSDRGKLRVAGEDRARLLHAMSTNSVQDLAAGGGLYAFFLNEKARVLCDAYTYNLGDALLLDTEPETAQKLRDHLDAYIIADDVTLEDWTERWAAIGLEGPSSLECAAELGIEAPEKKYAVREWKAAVVARVASTGPEGIRILVPVEEKEALVARLRSLKIPNASFEEARVVRLENGIPRYGEDISERNLAPETQVTDAIHSNKGCYLGQEIVERVRSRGQVHRLLTPIRMRSAAPPAPGSKLSAGGEIVGEITSAAFSPALGEVVALAYIRREAVEKKPEMVINGSDPAIIAYIV